MPDIHDFLDDEASRVRSEPGALGEVVERADRRRRTRRLATGALALAVAAGGIGLAVAAFRPSRPLDPSSGPVPGPTSSTSPLRGVILVGDRSSIEGAGEFARALLLGEGIRAEPMLLRARDRDHDITTIHCHPSREAEALQLRDRFFPGAELRPRVDADTLLVAVGDDFVRAHEDTFALYMLVRSFMTLRVAGYGAEQFLSDDAERQYRNGERGLSLYRYSVDSRFQIPRLEVRGDGSLEVDVIIVTAVGTDAVIIERITAGLADSVGPSAEVLAAEIHPTGPPYQEIQAFVHDFLAARRKASGAGTYLGERARTAYATHEDGLDLLRYAADENLAEEAILKYDRESNHGHLVVVRFTVERLDGSMTRIFELLTIEALEDGLVVADAERWRPG